MCTLGDISSDVATLLFPARVASARDNSNVSAVWQHIHFNSIFYIIKMADHEERTVADTAVLTKFNQAADIVNSESHVEYTMCRSCILCVYFFFCQRL